MDFAVVFNPEGLVFQYRSTETGAWTFPSLDQLAAYDIREADVMPRGAEPVFADGVHTYVALQLAETFDGFSPAVAQSARFTHPEFLWNQALSAALVAI